MSLPSLARVLVLWLLPYCSAAFALSTELVGSGFVSPLYVTAPPSDSERLFVVEQAGTIKILDLQFQTVRPTPFLTITGVSSGGERGLLGLAFHPNYASNGFFYVNLTNAAGNTEIRRYRVSAGDPNVADPTSNLLILTFAQPFSNHNGGWIGFGPNDNFLYIASGDGGSSNDPQNNAQNKNSLLGKILRIDVNKTTRRANYGIPRGNPFFRRGGAPEVWDFGLRNPWRCSFDRQNGNFWIADVGQNAREEIDFEPANDEGRRNYGWRAKEGSVDNPAVIDKIPRKAVDPIYDYQHGSGPLEGNCVTGGYVYRGSSIPALQGTYFFADFISGNIWSFRYDGQQISDFQNRLAELTPAEGNFSLFSSFGEGGTGELYIVSHAGDIFKIVP